MKVEADRFERRKMWTNGRADSSHFEEIVAVRARSEEIFF